MPFMASVITINTRPVAAAFKWKACCGRETQLNICMGITVKGDINQSKETKGNSALTGESGRNAINVKAPIVTSGAVSPMARESAMMMPVRMPPVE